MKFALVDIRIPDECYNTLSGFGYEVIRLPLFDCLPSPLSSHPDMLMHYNQGKLIVSKEYYEENRDIFDMLTDEGDISLILSDERPTRDYPYDAIFNALALGDKILLRERSASREILRLSEKEKLKILNTNQGYPACTALRLTDRHIITADRGIMRSAEEYGIKVTLIENGDISLPPYEYGFIGGACGVDDARAYFFGDIRTHRDYNIIKRACLECELTPISLGSGGLFDLGGIVFIPKKGYEY